MCSWCWAIAPELDRLREELGGTRFRIVTGGLRPGPSAQPVDDEMAAYLAGEWAKIEERTGQPFDHAILGERGWLYDTEPACRAVAVVRQLDEELAWPLFKRLQRAFYAEGVLLSDPDTLPPLVEEVGGDAAAFGELFESPGGKRLAWEDFGTARSWGVTSFPTVIARRGDEGFLLTVGYAPAETMLDRL